MKKTTFGFYSFLAILSCSSSVAFAQAPQIATMQQARLYAARMQGACETGAAAAKVAPGGACRCVGKDALASAIAGTYAALWQVITLQTQGDLQKGINNAPSGKRSELEAEMSAIAPYLITGEVEDAYETKCGDHHWYLRFLMPGYFAQAK